MKIICVEGPNGTGKRAQTHLICKFLEGCGVPTEIFHDPGVSDRHPCQMLRNYLLHYARDGRVATYTALAARTELVLSAGSWLEKEPKGVAIYDRYSLSTLAYQTAMLTCSGWDREDAVAWVQGIVRHWTGFVEESKPSLLVYLYAPEQVRGDRALHSARTRDLRTQDQFESRDAHFQKLLVELYEAMFLGNKNWLADHVERVDVSQHTPEEVFELYRPQVEAMIS